MNKKQLIEALSNFPDDAKIFASDGVDGLKELEFVGEIGAEENKGAAVIYFYKD